MGCGLCVGSALTTPPQSTNRQVKGGQHVNMVADQVVEKLMAAVKKKNKGQARDFDVYMSGHVGSFVARDQTDQCDNNRR